MTYFDGLVRTMKWLESQDKVIFLGQAVGCPGTAVYNTLKDVDVSKRLEMPVAEEFETGFALGLAIGGFTPILIHPRLNFLLCAMNQLINIIDKWTKFSPDTNQKVIIRTCVGSTTPLDPHESHKYNYTDAIRAMCLNMEVVELTDKSQIFEAYKKAYERTDGISTLLVEHPDLYNS